MSTANACVPRKPEATPSPGIYRRRRPERTVLCQAVQENIETYLSQARWEAPLGNAVPAYVEHDLRQYLTCGILAHGFARAFCDKCAHKSPHLSYTHFQLNQEIDIRDVNLLALYVTKTSHERS
jgi:hypothetical protein